MKYTKYFSNVLKNHGIPNLNVEQYSRFMNIVSLEGRMEELNDLKKSIDNPEEIYKYDIRIYRISNKIKGLTSDQYPKDVMENMVYKSK